MLYIEKNPLEIDAELVYSLEDIKAINPGFSAPRVKEIFSKYPKELEDSIFFNGSPVSFPSYAILTPGSGYKKITKFISKDSFEQIYKRKYNTDSVIATIDVNTQSTENTTSPEVN